jgi:hypothetical protein
MLIQSVSVYIIIVVLYIYTYTYEYKYIDTCLHIYGTGEDNVE